MLFKKSPKDEKSAKEFLALSTIESKTEQLPSALIRLMARIKNHVEEFLFLEEVARVGLKLLQAHRFTIFLRNEADSSFEAKCSLFSEEPYRNMGQAEEKDFSRKLISLTAQASAESSADPLTALLRESLFGQNAAVVSAAFFCNGNIAGAILAVRFQAKPPFSVLDQQIVFLLADFISLKMEDFFLHKEMEKSENIRKTHELYLDDLLAKLQTHFPPISPPTPQEEEPSPPLPQPQPIAEEGEPGVEGIITTPETDPKNRRQDERIETMVRVEFEDHDLGLTDNLSCGGAFVRTLTPLDLGEEFFMLLHLGDGAEPLAVDCKVVWTNQFGIVRKDLQRGMGIKFQKLSAEGRERLGSYIQRQKSRRAAELPPTSEKAGIKETEKNRMPRDPRGKS